MSNEIDEVRMPYIESEDLVIVSPDNNGDFKEHKVLKLECDGKYWEYTFKIKDPDMQGWKLESPVPIKNGDNTVGGTGYLNGVGDKEVTLFLRPNKGNWERTYGGNLLDSPTLMTEDGEDLYYRIEVVQHANEYKTFVDTPALNKFACNADYSTVSIPTRRWSFDGFKDFYITSDVDWVKFNTFYYEGELDLSANLKSGIGPWMFGGNTTAMLKYWKKALKEGSLVMDYPVIVLDVKANPNNEARVAKINICGEDFEIKQDGLAEKVSNFRFVGFTANGDIEKVSVKCEAEPDAAFPDKMFVVNSFEEGRDWVKIGRFTTDDPKKQGTYQEGRWGSTGSGTLTVEVETGEMRVCFLEFVDENGYVRQFTIAQ